MDVDHQHHVRERRPEQTLTKVTYLMCLEALFILWNLSITFIMNLK